MFVSQGWAPMHEILQFFLSLYCKPQQNSKCCRTLRNTNVSRKPHWNKHACVRRVLPAKNVWQTQLAHRWWKAPAQCYLPIHGWMAKKPIFPILQLLHKTMWKHYWWPDFKQLIAVTIKQKPVSEYKINSLGWPVLLEVPSALVASPWEEETWTVSLTQVRKLICPDHVVHNLSAWGATVAAPLRWSPSSIC